MRTSNTEPRTSSVKVQDLGKNPLFCFDFRRRAFNARRWYFVLTFACLLAITALAAAPATLPTSNPTSHPTTKAVIAPTAPHLQLRECTVFVLDASTGLLNPDGIVTATLPAMIPDKRYGSASTPAVVEQPLNNNNWVNFNGRLIRRNFNAGESDTRSADAKNQDIEDPSPVGIIRLIGSVDANAKVDVSITARGGTFAASWPKAEDRPNQLLWRDLEISDQPGVALATLADEHWLAKLRMSGSAYLSLKHVPSEKFLLYDLQMPYPSPLKIKSGKDDSVEITNGGKYPLHDLVLYRDGKEATAGDLAIAAPAPTKSAAKPMATTASTTLPVAKPATTAPTARSTATVHLATAATSQPGGASLRWAARMDGAGLEKADHDMIDRLLARYAVDKRMTAVYVMDPDELDHLLPLEVVPQPAKISRFALVIVINADPAAGNIVDDLIKQLGDDDWTRRDAAYHALSSMGPAATAKLQVASKGTDLEIAWRAERLLALNPQPPKP